MINTMFVMSFVKLCENMHVVTFIMFILLTDKKKKKERGNLYSSDMSLVVRKPVFGFLTWSDTNWAVQPQKIARDLKFGI